MKKIFRLLTLGTIILVLMFGCGVPPEEESGNKTSRIESKYENLKKKVEYETKNVAKILQKTGEKLRDIPKKIYEEKDYEDASFLKNGGYRMEEGKNQDYSRMLDVVRFQKEALESLKKDPLYQALSILENMRTKNGKENVEKF